VSITYSYYRSTPYHNYTTQYQLSLSITSTPSTMTTANISTILLIGATSGIGEQFARYFHSKGKTVIAAGRRLDRLTALSSELPGLKISQFDVENISSIAPKLTELFKSHPDIDAVFVLAGKMETGQFADPSTTTAESIASEITVNMTAPIIIARTVIPHHSSPQPRVWLMSHYHISRFTMLPRVVSITSMFRSAPSSQEQL